MRFSLGWGGNQLAQLWGPHDNDASSVNSYIAGGGTYRSFRGPSSVRLDDGRLAEFVSGQESGTLDYQISSIFVRFSSDEGETWTPPQLVYRRSDYASGTKWINVPCVPVVHPSGRVHVLFTKSDATVQGTDDVMTLYTITSADNCATWSAETNISATTIKANSTTPAGLPAAYGKTNAAWNWYMMTCAIVIQHGANAGRIVASGDHRYAISGAGSESYSHCIYTDNGESATPTWALGGGYDETNVTNDDSNECEVMEIGDSGDLYFNNRIVASGVYKRGQATLSGDITDTWPTMTFMSDGSADVVANQCRAGSLSHHDGSLWMSFPVNRSLRSRIKIFRSTDDGVSWPQSRTIDYGYSGYSELVELHGGVVRCGFELAHNFAADVFAQYTGQARVNEAWLLSTTTPAVFDYHFNELPAGQGAGATFNAAGTLILDHGDNGQRVYDNRGKGGTNATYHADGLLFGGSGTPTILQEVAADGVGGPLDPGRDSITYEFEIKIPASGATYTVYDTGNGCDAAGEFGISIFFSGLGRLQARIRDNANNNATSSTGSTNLIDGTFRRFAVIVNRTTNTIQCFEITSGSAVSVGTAASIAALTGPIYGALPGSLGVRATDNTTHLPSGSYIRRFRVTRGIRTGNWLTENQAKQTPDSLMGYTPAPTSVANSPASYAGNILWLGATTDGGAYARTDQYGAWDRHRMPVQLGDGAIAYRDLAGNQRFNFGSSLLRGMYRASDADVGPHWRHMYLSTTACANYNATAVNTAYDAPQNTGLFAAFVCLKLLTDATVTLFDTCNNSASTAGWGLYRTSGAGALTLRLSDGSGVALLNETLPTITLGINTWTCLGIVGNGAGVVLDAYKATISAGVVSAVTHVQSVGNLASALSRPTPNPLSVFARVGSASGACNVRAKNVALWSAARTAQDFADLCAFCASA